MSKTYTEQLAEVQAEITAILQRGQSYKIADREKKRADLATLKAEEQRLRRLAKREASGGVRFRRGVIG